MKIKMIIMDMDGTLLNQDHVITPKTKEALIEAEHKGIRLVLASGRSYRTLTPYGKELLMDQYDGRFICVNGAAITCVPTHTTTYIRQLTPEEMQEIFTEALPYEVEIMAVQDAVIYDYIPDSLRELKYRYRVEHNIAPDVPYTSGAFHLIDDQRTKYAEIYEIKSKEEITVTANKMTISHEPEVIAKIYDQLVQRLGSKYHLVRTTPRWIEVSPLGITKGNAIQLLSEEFGIKKDEIMVFGDGENDLTMFEQSAYPIAMGNAMETVKNAAYAITGSCDEDGIAKALEKYVL